MHDPDTNPLSLLDTLFKNSCVQHFDMFKLRIFIPEPTARSVVRGY
jgi:hypothetical protein